MNVMRSVLALLLALMVATALAQQAPGEEKKIAQLIGAVERLQDAKFVRNDSAYEAKAAAEHLRLKLREAGTRVKTAEDFIRLCGSRSSVSGKPYQIRFDDGRTMTSEAFLRARLAELAK